MKHSQKEVAPFVIEEATQGKASVAHQWTKRECAAIAVVCIGFEALIFALYCMEVAL